MIWILRLLIVVVMVAGPYWVFVNRPFSEGSQMNSGAIFLLIMGGFLALVSTSRDWNRRPHR